MNMASSKSYVTLNVETAEKPEKRISLVSQENLSPVKDEHHLKRHTETDNASIRTDETNTGTDEISIETDDAGTGTDDASTETGDTSTDTDDVAYAPDGGWGWMVTLAGFVVAFIIDGVVSSFGLVIPELLTTFDAGMSLTSFPPAILGAMYMLSGPVTAYLVKRWGCRLVGFCGGVVAALGVAGSAFAPSIHIFILCFGVVAGVGTGLIYLPSVTMVNVYFHRKRGVVAGIITSGSGFGLLALAPLTEMLMEEYGWRGCHLIMAAITLHFCVCATLMRPLPHPPSPNPLTPPALDREIVIVERLGVGGEPPPGSEEDSLSLVSIREVGKMGGEFDPLCPAIHVEGESQDCIFPKTKTHVQEEGPTSRLHCRIHAEDSSDISRLPRVVVLQDSAERGLQTRSDHQSHLDQQSHHESLWSSVKSLFLGHHVTSGSHAPTSSDVIAGRGQNVLTRSRSQGHLHSPPSLPPPHHKRVPVNVLSTWLACQVPPSLSRHTLHSQQSSDSMTGHHGGWEQETSEWTTSGSKCSENKIAWGQSLPSMPHHADDSVKHDGLKDHLKTHGFPHLSTKRSANILQQPSRADSPLIPCHPSSSTSKEHSSPSPSSLAPSPEPEGEEEKKKGVGRWVIENRSFALFLTGAFLIQLVCSVPPLLAPSYAYLCGVSKDRVATILAIYGLLNTAGRLLAGALVYCGARALHVYNLGTLLSAGACFTFPLSSSFPTIALCLGLHGFFLGAFPPLQSVILVEYLGLDRLTSTFGTMCLVKAFASAAGAPLAGLLFTLTGTYTVPVVVCGAVLVMAAIFHQLMDCWP